MLGLGEVVFFSPGDVSVPSLCEFAGEWRGRLVRGMGVKVEQEGEKFTLLIIIRQPVEEFVINLGGVISFIPV